MKRENLTRRARYGIMAALIAGAFSIMPATQAMPTGGTPTAGVGIETNGNIMDITSTVGNNLITWQNFSVAANEQVKFDTNTYLNYVKGSNPSEIMGKITGGGDIYLVNPNGIVVGDGAQIDVGNLHLSTAKLGEENLGSFAAAQMAFTSAVNFSGDVVNKGTLNAGVITVQGENITFKNVADVTAATVNLQSKNPAHLGQALGEEATAVNDTQYVGMALSSPAWTFKDNSGENVLEPINYALVRNAYELQNMKNNLSGNFMLAKDIVLAVPSGGDSNFTPIGSSSAPFLGKFDGLGYTISNLVIYKPMENNVGLWGQIGRPGGDCDIVIENVGLVNGSITGNGSVGSIAGFAHVNNGKATIRNVYNKGTVTGNSGIGGLVGTYGSNVIIISSYNTGDVTGTGNYVGGIAGNNMGGNSISYCYNSGNITGNDYVSGIFQFGGNYVYNSGTVKGNNYVGGIAANCYYRSFGNVYNTGEVVGTGDYVGGIAGNFNDMPWMQEKTNAIDHAYNLGQISGNGDNVGAVVGSYDASEERFQEVYYASEVVVNNAKENATVNARGSEKSLEDLTNPETFSDSWNMSEDGAVESGWRIYPGHTTPLLTAFMKPLDVTNYAMSSVYTGEAILVGQGATGVVTVRDVGEYNFADLSSLYSNQQGYNIHISEGITNLKYTVTPATLTVTAAATNKVYDGQSAIEANAGSYNVSGLLAGDTYTNPVIAFADKNIGVDKTISISGGTLSDGNNGANYAVTYVGSKGTITAKELTLAANAVNVTKLYDGTTAINDQAKFTVTGMVAGDDVYLNKSNITVAYPSADAGNYELTFTANGAVGLAGTDAGNYSLAGTLDNLAGTGTITPKKLTVSFANTTKVYDGLLTAVPGAASLTGVLAGDTVGLADGIQAEYANKDAGEKVVNYSGLALTGSSATNYAIDGEAVGTGTITPKLLTVSFGDTAKDYDGTTSAIAGTAQLSGLIAGDTVGIADGFSAQYDSKNVGERSVNYSGISLTGASAGNYMIGKTAQGSGSIAAVPVTFKADDYTKVYDGTTSAQGATFSVYEGSLFGSDLAGAGVFAFEDSSAGTGKVLQLTQVTIEDGNGGKNYIVSYLPSLNSTITQVSPMMINAAAVANSSAENNYRLKRRPLAEGLTLSNYQQLSSLASSGVNTPAAMSFDDILTMWAFSE